MLLNLHASEHWWCLTMWKSCHFHKDSYHTPSAIQAFWTRLQYHQKIPESFESLRNFTLTNVFWNCSITCSLSYVKIGEPLSTFTSEKFCFYKMICLNHLHHHVTDLLPISLISCKVFLQLFPFSSTFPAFLLPWSQLW